MQSNRINTPFTNEHFAAWCLAMLGQPYWYGTCAYKCTASLLKRKGEQYPTHYSESRQTRYKDDIAQQKVCADCVGGCKGYAWTGGGQAALDAIGTSKSVASKYGSHGCPDKSANGMFNWAKSKGMAWGTIDAIPETVGLAVRFDGHVGYYVGNGEVVEWRGFAYGCVKTKLSERKWTHWYKLPFIDYGEDGGSVQPEATEKHTTIEDEQPAVLGSRLLTHGANGEDVRTLQEHLIQLGYSLPSGADGDYGDETEMAVCAFQRAASLKVDGKYGEKTHTALLDALAGKLVVPEEPAPASGTKVVIVSAGGKVNIRNGNDLRFGRITSVAPGTTFDYVATAANGWHAVQLRNQVGWVSGEYSRVI